MDGDHNYIPHHEYHTYDHNINTPSTVTNSLDLLLSNPNIQILPDQPTVQQSQSAHAEIDWISLLYGSNKYDDDHEQSPSVSFMAKHDKELRENYGSKNKSKSIKAKKANPPRIAFHTRTADDVLEDGYKWRKYGQKSVKNNIHPRSYFRCSYPTCNVKKQIQRLSKDPSIVVTTYEGIHNHPCAKLMETLSPLIKQLQFLSRI